MGTSIVAAHRAAGPRAGDHFPRVGSPCRAAPAADTVASMTARLLAIYLRPGARLPVRAVGEALAIAGQGLDRDHAGGGKRQVTLLAREGWERACAELGTTVDPAVRRANLFVEGVDLGACIGSALQIGDVV